MSDDQKTELVRQYLEEVLNKRNYGAAASFFAEDRTDHLAGSLTTYIAFSAFPDFDLSVEHMVAEDDMVTVLATFTGTHKGQFLGLAPTDQGVTGRAAFTFRLAGGKIAETWAEIEPWTLLSQLGGVAVG